MLFLCCRRVLWLASARLVTLFNALAAALFTTLHAGGLRLSGYGSKGEAQGGG